MALSFLRHLKPENLKSRKKSPATEIPLHTDHTAQTRLKDESPADDTVSDQYTMVVDGKRADEEEKESGISMDSSMELSRQESNESQETDPEVDSLSTLQDLEDGRTAVGGVPFEGHTVFTEGQLEDAASDIDAPEFSADAEEEGQDEIRSSYVDADAESLEHCTRVPLLYSEADMTDNFHSSLPTSFPQVSEELLPEQETTTMPTLSSSTNQYGEDAVDDTESSLSTTSRQDSVMEPGAFISSQSQRLGSSEDSLHSQDSSEISLSMIPAPPVLPPPPPPPPLGLLLPGDHTTSSTTDFQPTSKSVSKQGASAAADRDEGTEDELMRQIQTAARKMSNQREVFSHLDKGFPNAKSPTQLPESFSTDLKSVIASRQSRIGTPQIDGGEIPGRSTFYKSRIGIPAEDTELRRVFLKRAAKAPPENAPERDFADIKPAAFQGVMGIGDTGPPIMTSDSRKSSPGDTRHFKASNSDESNFHASIADEVTEQSTSADEDATVDKYEEKEDTEQDVNEEMSWKNESDDGADKFPSTTIQNSDFEQDTEFPVKSRSNHATEEKDFDKVVDDFDQFLEENTSDYSWKESSEIPLPPQGQIQISPVLDPKDRDVEFRNGKIGSSEPAYTNSMSENSLSLSPNLSSFSEAESPVFEEMDEVALSKSAQTVQERSKLLAQPLESYNILPTIQETSTKSELKPKFSFRNIMATLRNTVGRRKPSNAKDSKRFSLGDGSQIKFDNNWSIHDTLTHRGNPLEDHNKNKSPSLKDVFANYEVRSFSEYTDSDQNSGKDFSVRNWKEVMERSNEDVRNISETLDQGLSPDTAGFTGLLTKRANSTPNLGSLRDSKYSSQMDKQYFSAFSTKSSRAVKKPKSSYSKDDMEELTSNTSVESPSRQASSTLNSTLPSRHLHGMMQSFDSIYPGAPSLDQKRYQKKAEPRKFSLPSMAPVQRRRQRSEQAKR